MRCSEMLALRHNDVDLDGGVIRVEHSLAQSKARGVRFKQTKTEKVRHISIGPDLAALLRAHRARQMEEQFKLGGKKLPADALVFPRSPLDVYKPWPRKSVSREFSRRAKKVLGRPGFKLHSLRHVHAALLLGAGVSVNIVSERLGHAKASMTLDRYSYAIPAAAVNAAGVVGELIRKAEGR